MSPHIKNLSLARYRMSTCMVYEDAGANLSMDDSPQGYWLSFLEIVDTLNETHNSAKVLVDI